MEDHILMLVADHWQLDEVERAVVEPGDEFPLGPSWWVRIGERSHGLYGFAATDDLGQALGYNHMVLAEAMQNLAEEGETVHHEHPMATVEGFLGLESDGIVWTLMNAVPAPLANHGSIGQQHRLSMGRRIGLMHELLATAPAGTFEPIASSSLGRVPVHGQAPNQLLANQRDLLRIMQAQTARSAAARFWVESHDEIADHRRHLLILRQALPGSLPHQMIHGDLALPSFGFHDDEAVALRRFRLLHVAPRVLDLAPDLATLPAWYAGRGKPVPNHEAVDVVAALAKDDSAAFPLMQADAIISGYLDTAPYPLYPDEIGALTYAWLHQQLTLLLDAARWWAISPDQRDTVALERMARHLLLLRALREVKQEAWLELPAVQRSLTMADGSETLDEVEAAPVVAFTMPSSSGGETSLLEELGTDGDAAPSLGSMRD